MFKVIVTGCAGFVGSHLVERLLKDGHTIVGIDNFSDHYPRGIKEKNMEGFVQERKFKFVEGDLLEADLKKLLNGVDVVFHQAAQAGVRDSWGVKFDVYTRNNILATQTLLEACKDSRIRKFIYASSSSIYGDAESMPTKEDVLPKPISPYGVSKLAGEHLCYLYWKIFRVPTISLRYFSVYGPRQRPDMGFYRFVDSVLRGVKLSIYGTGEQTRDFTYVSDIVDGNISAMMSKQNGDVFNIGGGSRISVNDCVKIIEKILDKRARIERVAHQSGDAGHTYADISKARKMLGYKPEVCIEDGLNKQALWMKNEVFNE